MAKTGQNAFGEALRKALDGRKLPWLAEATGIDVKRFYRLTTGRGVVTLAEAAAIASALNVPVETFLPPAPGESAVAAEEESPLPFVSVPHTLETLTPARSTP